MKITLLLYSCFFCLMAMFLVFFRRAVKKKKPLKAVKHLLALSFVVLLLFAFSAIKIGMHGYRSLLREDLALTVSLLSQGKQRFQAAVSFPDGGIAVYDIDGDELYIDAQVIKWKPLANFAGLHTWYRLDRIGGRYADIKDEKEKSRTLYSLSSRNKYLDLFYWARHYSILAPFVDASYGSASFIPVKDRHTVDIMVSTTGLLIRESR